ncbi:PfkB family carbohydrate kinase [Pelagibacteraceae bacterium]|nr:PfkB family carbohydrate kinase [Pelagibacteraceae bacterium]
MKNKIVDFLDLKKIRKKYKNKKIGLAHGAFDLFHYGHLLHLRKAKSMCDILVVTVTSSKYVKKGPGRPLYKDNQRLDYLSSISLVDYVSLSNFEGAVEVINNLKPDIYIKGNEYESKENDITGKISKEIKTVLKNKGKVHFTDELTLSSTNIINKHFSSFSEQDKKYLRKMKKTYSFEKIKTILDSITKYNVLVVGDTIIDKYIFTSSLGKSPKEGIISVKENNQEIYAGGILATVNHISDFVGKVTLLTVLGDEKKDNNFVIKQLNKKINKKIFYQNDFKTITKTRYINSSNAKLFQTSNENEIILKKKIEKKIISYLKKNIRSYDIVIVNDFGHGLLTEKIRNFMQKQSKYLAVNTQTNSSNVGYHYITKYSNADYISIDEPEARLALQDKFSPSDKLFRKLRKKIKFKFGSITFGANGTKVYGKNLIHFAPALADKPVDTLGAGDAYFSLSSLCSKEVGNQEVIGFLGNIAGALEIGNIGHRKYLNKQEVLNYAKSFLN